MHLGGSHKGELMREGVSGSRDLSRKMAERCRNSQKTFVNHIILVMHCACKCVNVEAEYLAFKN